MILHERAKLLHVNKLGPIARSQQGNNFPHATAGFKSSFERVISTIIQKTSNIRLIRTQIVWVARQHFSQTPNICGLHESWPKVLAYMLDGINPQSVNLKFLDESGDPGVKRGFYDSQFSIDIR